MAFFNFNGYSSREFGLTEATRRLWNSGNPVLEDEEIETPEAKLTMEQEMAAAKARWEKRLKHKENLKRRKQAKKRR